MNKLPTSQRNLKVAGLESKNINVMDIRIGKGFVSHIILVTYDNEWYYGFNGACLSVLRCMLNMAEVACLMTVIKRQKVYIGIYLHRVQTNLKKW